MILSVSGVTADTSDPLNGAGVTPVYAGKFALRIKYCHRTILSQKYPSNPNYIEYSPLRLCHRRELLQ